MKIQFDNTYSNLPSVFFDLISGPNKFRPELIAFNHELAKELGFDASGTDSKLLAEYFSANIFIPGSRPVAMAYAAHQFGHFIPQLGDGRAMLLGEFLTPDRKRYDIHLKGSGQTAFSRRGDGRSAIGPVIREYLMSEGMNALGVPTTRTLAAVRTGELVHRQESLPGAVLTRIAQSHIRIGTFQFFAHRGDFENLRILADYTMKRLYPDTENCFEFWKAVAIKQAKLIAQWMSFGFIHGVMNTDNMAISGETIDYGPCAFMDEFNFNKVFSSIDQNGRYAFGNQSKIALWNLARLAECLIPIMGDNIEASKTLFEKELGFIQQRFQDENVKLMSQKLGINNHIPSDTELVKNWLHLLESNSLDFTLSYIDLERILEGKTTFTGLEKINGCDLFVTELKKRIGSVDEATELMKKYNPLTTPRNHQVELAIKCSESGDDSVFFALLEKIKNPFHRMDELSSYELAPKVNERVLQTFCGT